MDVVLGAEGIIQRLQPEDRIVQRERNHPFPRYLTQNDSYYGTILAPKFLFPWLR